jgi:TolB protein
VAARPAPSTSPVAGTPVVQTVVPGTLIYGSDDALARLHGTTLTPILKGSAVFNADASPDGQHLAYVDDHQRLIEANGDGTGARTLRASAVDAGYGPAWAADSSTLVTALSQGENTVPGILAGKTFTPLPPALKDYLHFLPTGDGSRLVFTNGECVLFSAKPDGTDLRKVPVLGSQDGSVNPKQLRGCDVVSVNADGSRITVDLHKGEQPDGDIGGSRYANAVIETATGQVLPLPVHGTVTQMLFRPDSSLLVRTVTGGKGTLTMLSPGLDVLATMAEPAGIKDYNLRDWTR